MSGDLEPAVRLNPPPRPPAGPGPRATAPGDRRRGWAVALTAAGLVALAGLAVSVFLLLPSWVEQRPRPVAPGAPAEDPAQPVPPIVPAVAVAESPRAEAEPSRGSAIPEKAAPVAQGSAPAPVSRPAPRRAPGPEPPAPGPAEPAAFDVAMGQGLAALAAGDAAAARQAFARAVALEPESAPAAEGLARAEETIRTEKIAVHREAARVHVEAERWAEALAEHEAALALDPTLEFARAGAENARRRAALDEQLVFHLARPDRLTSEAVRAEVEGLLARAAGVVDAGARLRDQTDRLGELVARATTPVEVVLESDELTEVTVYRVGELGRFRRQELELLAGRYVVVGRRAGYRDVRLELVVDPGAPPPVVTVSCQERI